MLLYMKRDLTKEDFALESTFPIKTPEDVIMAAECFHLSPILKRVKLGEKINKRAEELGIKIPSNRADSLFIAFATKKNVEDTPDETTVYKDEFDEMIARYEQFAQEKMYLEGFQISDTLLIFYILVDTAIALSKNPFSKELKKQYDCIGFIFWHKETHLIMKRYVMGIMNGKAIGTMNNGEPTSLDGMDIYNLSMKDIEDIITSADDLVYTTKYLEKINAFHKEDMITTNQFSMDNVKTGGGDLIDSLEPEWDAIFQFGKNYCETTLSDRNKLIFSRLKNKYDDAFYWRRSDGNKVYMIQKDDKIGILAEDANKRLLIFYFNEDYELVKIKAVEAHSKRYDNLTEGFSIDEDGTVKFNISKLNMMDEYMSNHRKLKVAMELDNLDEAKLILAQDFAMIDSIEHTIKTKKFLTQTKKDELVKARQFLMNDFKTYLRQVNKKDPKFNFATYYNNCEEVKDYYKIDSKTINGIKTLLRTIML